MHFKTVNRAQLPQGRNGKHKEIVDTIVKDLERLKPGSALEIPLADLAYSKEKIRSALNRATRKLQINVATSSDERSLYVWSMDDAKTTASKSSS